MSPVGPTLQTAEVPRRSELLGKYHKAIEALPEEIQLYGLCDVDNPNYAGYPDPQPLPVGLKQVPKFDDKLLPQALKAWVLDIAVTMQCPIEFVAVTAISAMGAALGRKIGVRPQENTDWTEYANNWAILIGRPGVMKSPAMSAALKPIKRIEDKLAEGFKDDYAAYEIALKASKIRAKNAEKEAEKSLAKDRNADLSSVLSVDEVDEPTMPRIIANDSTVAALSELFRKNPNGILVFRDEVVSLLKGLDREDRAEERGFYLTGWNGNDGYTVDRIGRGMNLRITAVCLSVLGSTQPGRFSDYIRHAVKGGVGDDGLVQRFGLLVWPDTSKEWRDVDRPPNAEAKNVANKVYEKLYHLNPEDVGAQFDDNGNAYLRFDPEAQEIFREWRRELETRLREEELHHALESHLSKYRKLIPSLALLFHLADGHTGPINSHSTLQALAWGDLLEKHAVRAYGSVTAPETQAAVQIVKKIRKGDIPRQFTARDIYRKGWAKLSDREEVINALKLLSDLDWLFEFQEDTSGRAKTGYEVNPKVCR